MSQKNSHKRLGPDYKKLFADPPLLTSKAFSLWQRSNEQQKVRYSVMVKKKNIKKAVERNKAKRTAKEIFKTVEERFFNKDIVLIIKVFEGKKNKKDWKQSLLSAYLWLEHACWLLS